MNPASDSRFNQHPELQDLHAALTSSAEIALGDPDDDDAGLDGLADALDDSMLSPTVRRYVDELLLGGEVPTPATREVLTKAARRGLTRRRGTEPPLPVLLATRRIDRQMDVEELANVLDRTTADVYKMESGSLNVRDLGAQAVASWTRAVEVEPDLAIEALRRVLEVSTPSRTALAAGRGGSRRQISAEDERLLAEVQTLLQIPTLPTDGVDRGSS